MWWLQIGLTTYASKVGHSKFSEPPGNLKIYPLPSWISTRGPTPTGPSLVGAKFWDLPTLCLVIRQSVSKLRFFNSGWSFWLLRFEKKNSMVWLLIFGTLFKFSIIFNLLPSHSCLEFLVVLFIFSTYNSIQTGQLLNFPQLPYILSLKVELLIFSSKFQ